MKRFLVGADRGQSTLLPECLDEWIDESNPVRAVDAFVDALDLGKLGFEGVVPEVTGRPSYHPSALLKLYIYGYLNRVQSSRRLEREAGRNLEVIWLLGRLVPDDKTIADFRKDNGSTIRKVCAQFVALCRDLGLLTKASVAIDGSKFKAVNNLAVVSWPLRLRENLGLLIGSLAQTKPVRLRLPLRGDRGASSGFRYTQGSTRMVKKSKRPKEWRALRAGRSA